MKGNRVYVSSKITSLGVCRFTYITSGDEVYRRHRDICLSYSSTSGGVREVSD